MSRNHHNPYHPQRVPGAKLRPAEARRPSVRLAESDVQLTEREYTAAERSAMAKSGEALPDGSFPIRTAADVEHAVRLWGHSENPAAAKAHIIKCAQALGVVAQLPPSWHEEGRNYSAALERTERRTEGSRDVREGVAKQHEGEATDGRTSPNEVRFMETDLADVTTVEADGKHVLEVTLIRAGTSKMGNAYSREVLREAAPLFEGCRCFVDHQAPDDRPERSVRDLVGYYKHVHLDEAGRLRGQLHLIPGQEWLFHLLREAEGNPDLCGLSIDAWGTESGTTGGIRQVAGIARVMSCDIVTRPSAGGQIDRLIHSDRSTTTGRNMDPSTTTPAPTPTDPAVGTAAPSLSAPAHVQETQKPDAGAAGNGPDLAKLLEELRSERDRYAQELAKVTSVLAPQSQANPADLASQQIVQLAEELKRERDLAAASALLDAKLREAELPDPVQRKLQKRFAGQVFEVARLEEAIKDEKETLAALTSIGAVTGHNYEKAVSMGMSEIDQVQAAFDKLFDIVESDAARSVPAFAGIREAFFVCTGRDIGSVSGPNAPLTEALQYSLRSKVARGRLTEGEVLLREADVTTSTFSYLLGTSMNKRLLADYQAWPSEWQKFSTIVPIKDFKLQNRIRLGAFGSLSTVAEDSAYTTLTIADTQATYQATKRGNLVQITRETIVNDDLYAIKQIPQKLAVAAAFTLAEFVYNLLAPGGGNIYDSHPLFDSVNHKNTAILAADLGTANSGSTLSTASLETAVINMRKQTNLAGKPIGLKPRFLLVPPDLEFTAMTILKSAGLPGGNNNDINPMMGYAEPIVSPQLNSLASGPTSTSIWIAVADPRIIDTVEIGFVGGQANPVLLIQDMPLYGLNFTQDVISYKVRHEYGGAVVDYRGFYLGNN